MKYSTRPKNTRDRSPKVKMSPHINFQKHHRPHILTIPETQPVSIPVVQPTQKATGKPVTVIAKVQQPRRPSSASAQPTPYIVLDDQQPGTSRQMLFNPPSVAQEEESEHNTSGLSSLFAVIPSVLTYQQMDTPQQFSPSQFQPAPSPVLSSTHHEESRPASQSSQQSESAQISGLARTNRTKPSPSQGHLNLPKTINKLHVYAQIHKKHTIQHLHLPTVHKKNCVNELVNVKQILRKFHHKPKKINKKNSLQKN